MMRLAILAAAAALAAAAPAAAAPADDFRAPARRALSLAAEQRARPMRPRSACATMTTASSDLSPEARERQRARGAGLPRPARARSRPTSSRRPTGSTARILRRSLAEAIEADGFGQRDMLFTTYDGWHQGFAGMARNLPFRTRADLRKLSDPDRAISAAQRSGAGDHPQCGARPLRPALLGARRARAHASPA